MPLYEFQCPACGVRQERIQAYDDPAPMCSDGCKEVRTVRQHSAPAFAFKGSGWAKDGYSKTK